MLLQDILLDKLPNYIGKSLYNRTLCSYCNNLEEIVL